MKAEEHHFQKFLCLCCTLLFVHHACAEIDENSNQLSDVWEAANVIGLSANDDLDGDSFKNREEAAAGTDPLSGMSYPRISSVTSVTFAVSRCSGWSKPMTLSNW